MLQRQLLASKYIRASVLFATAAFLVGGVASLVVWQWTTDIRWVISYFRIPGALLLIALTIVEFCLSFQVSREFSSGDPLLTVWNLITVSALFDLAGAIAFQVFGSDSALNPLMHLEWWPAYANSIRDWGLFLGGPCRLLSLAAGLMFALNLYRRAGFLGKLNRLSCLAIGSTAIYVIIEAAATISAILHGRRPGLVEISHYPTDPLLLVLLTEAMFLYHSAIRTGVGWISQCWKSMAFGVLLTSFGDVLLLSSSYGYLKWPWSAISWYVWFPAAAFFAVAPTYQLEATTRARLSRELNTTALARLNREMR